MVVTMRRSAGFDARSDAMFDLARRYAGLHAAACCIELWIHNASSGDEFFARGDWLVLCLARLLGEQTRQSPALREVADRVLDRLCALHREHRLFSLFPIELPRHRDPAGAVPPDAG
jgi:hypothetical protein